MKKKKKYTIMWGKERWVQTRLDRGGYYYQQQYPKATIYELGAKIKPNQHEQ